jgi:hypothetical protein
MKALRIAPLPDVDKDLQAEIEMDCGTLPPLLPEGNYQAVLTHHETAIVFRSAKVFLYFRIIDPGDWFGKILYRPYRVKSLAGKPSRNGGFRVTRGGDLFDMLCRVLDIRSRPDRVSVAPLRGKVLKIRVRTVIVDHQQRPLRDWMRYTVVADVLRMETT